MNMLKNDVMREKHTNQMGLTYKWFRPMKQLGVWIVLVVWFHHSALENTLELTGNKTRPMIWKVRICVSTWIFALGIFTYENAYELESPFVFHAYFM